MHCHGGKDGPRNRCQCCHSMNFLDVLTKTPAAGCNAKLKACGTCPANVKIDLFWSVAANSSPVKIRIWPEDAEDNTSIPPALFSCDQSFTSMHAVCWPWLNQESAKNLFPHEPVKLVLHKLHTLLR